MFLPSIGRPESGSLRRVSEFASDERNGIATLVRPVSPILEALRLRAYALAVAPASAEGPRFSATPDPSTATYQQALRAFQAGLGTPVRSIEQRHVGLLVPRIDSAPSIGVPAPGAGRQGLVGEQDITAEHMIGRHGPIEGPGMLFWSGGAADEGSWQPVRADGTGIIIFSNASDEQFAAMQDKLLSLSGPDGDISLKTIDSLLRYTHSLGIHDRYKSTLPAIADPARFEWEAPNAGADADAANVSLVRLIRKPTLTRALFVPPGSPLAWDIHGSPTPNVIRRGAMIVVSNDAPFELRHIETRDAEAHYRIADTGEPVRLLATGNPNVERLPAKSSQRPGSATAPVRQIKVIGEVSVAAHAGHTREVTYVNSRDVGTVKLGVPGIFKPVPEDFHVVEEVSLPDAARWFEYAFDVMRKNVAGLRGGAMVTLASIQGVSLTIAHAGDTQAKAFVQDAHTKEVIAYSLVPDQSIDDYVTLLKAFRRGTLIEERLGPAAHIDLESGELFQVHDRVERHVNDGMSTPHSVGGYATNKARREGQSGTPYIEQIDIDTLRRHPDDRVFLWLSSDGLVDVHPSRENRPTRGNISYDAYAQMLRSLIEEGRESEFAARAIDHAIARHSTDDKTVLFVELTPSAERHLLVGVIDGHSGPNSARAIAASLKEEADRTRRRDPSQPAWAHSADIPRPRAHYISPYSKGARAD